VAWPSHRSRSSEVGSRSAGLMLAALAGVGAAAIRSNPVTATSRHDLWSRTFSCS
jgi:hypothetical protein